MYEADYYTVPLAEERGTYGSVEEVRKTLEDLEKKMFHAAEKWEFEAAAAYRDKIKALTKEHPL